MRLHVAYADYPQEYNTSVWRCFIPGKALERVGHEVTYSHYLDIDKYDAESYLIERNFFDSHLIESVSGLRKAGKRVVATFDDAYALMPDYSPTKRSWGQEALARFNKGLRLANCVIVPSKLLASDYHLRDIRYIPNYADPELYQHERKQHPTFNILWGGNLTHLHSVRESGILGALEKVCSRNENVGVVVVSGDPLVVNAFSEVVPTGKIMASPWMPLAYWTEFIAQWADVLVCPVSGEYDRRRSWVKSIDAVMYGIPMVATRLDPYMETGALLVGNTEKAWYTALSDMVKSPMRRNAVVRRMKETLGDVTIDAHIKEYEDALCNSRLTA